MPKNEHGLGRHIESETALAVRKRCGFGCVNCGCPIIEYHHFNPPFAQATRHDPEGITLLCGHCHNRAERGIDDPSVIVIANASPWCVEHKHTRYDVLSRASVEIPVRLGSSRVCAKTVIMFDDETVIGFSSPEYPSGPVRLNAVLKDDRGNETLRVVNNEWRVGIERYDIQTTRDRLTIRESPNKVILEMSLQARMELSIRKLQMTYDGFSVVADKNSFSLTTPSGSRFVHKGEVRADVGIWMKSTGECLIAADVSGTAAVRIGGSPKEICKLPE